MAGCPLYTRATVVCAGRILSVAGTGPRKRFSAMAVGKSSLVAFCDTHVGFLVPVAVHTVHFIFQGTEQHLLYLCRKVTYLFKKQRAAIGFLPKTLLSTFYLYP